jgi:basic membrane protein A
VQKAEADIAGLQARVAVSADDAALIANTEAFATEKCNFILTVGWQLAQATGKVATANPDINFAIVDNPPVDDNWATLTLPNVKPILFSTEQAAFLAGYVAAATTKTGIVAAFGGTPEAPVKAFLDGFADGIDKFNADNGATVKLLGWNKAKQDGTFSGDYTDIAKGKTLSEQFIAQGADIILPVAGQVGEGAGAAALEKPGTSVIWVDSDGYVTAPANYKSIMLTSIQKNMTDAVPTIIGDSHDGNWSNSTYIGTLENGGVSIAPQHDLAWPAGLAEKIDALKADIISGALKVVSASTPQ